MRPYQLGLEQVFLLIIISIRRLGLLEACKAWTGRRLLHYSVVGKSCYMPRIFAFITRAKRNFFFFTQRDPRETWYIFRFQMRKITKKRGKTKLEIFWSFCGPVEFVGWLSSLFFSVSRSVFRFLFNTIFPVNVSRSVSLIITPFNVSISLFPPCIFCTQINNVLKSVNRLGVKFWTTSVFLSFLNRQTRVLILIVNTGASTGNNSHPSSWGIVADSKVLFSIRYLTISIRYFYHYEKTFADQKKVNQQYTRNATTLTSYMFAQLSKKDVITLHAGMQVIAEEVLAANAIVIEMTTGNARAER